MNRDRRYLTTTQLADRFCTAESTIRWWRMQNYGPQGVKVGRRVLYRLEDVEAWEQELHADAGLSADQRRGGTR